eukprot:50388-Pyramimonas_sp.AAC.1
MSSRLRSITSSTRRREFSGKFSRTLNTWHEHIRERPLQEIKFVTWNTRALLHHRPDVRRKKAAKLKLFCRGAGAVALQEVHGCMGLGQTCSGSSMTSRSRRRASPHCTRTMLVVWSR